MAVKVGISLLIFRYFILFYLSTSISKWVWEQDYLSPKYLSMVPAKILPGSLSWPRPSSSSWTTQPHRPQGSEKDSWRNRYIFCVISSAGWDWLSREVPCTFFLCGHLAIDINCTPTTLTEGTKSLPFSPPIYFNIVSFKVEVSLGSLHKLIWSKEISSLNPLLLAQ